MPPLSNASWFAYPYLSYVNRAPIMASDQSTPILLAFSGGLDTSFCVPWLKETTQRPVITVTVDTGGLSDAEAATLEQRAYALGALEHRLIPAKKAYFEKVLRFLIMLNARRGGLYPYCVGAERVLQAQLIASEALTLQSQTVAHGCTAAGNDQVRFEVALRTLHPNLEILAPVRDQAFKRPEQVAFLEQRRLPIPPFGARYSVNRGLWGVTIGGTETLTSTGTIAEEAWVLSAGAFEQPQATETHTLGFECGIPVSLDGTPLDPVTLIETLEAHAARFGIGRGIHLGDTVIGTKGRVAFEAPAAEVILTAHRELEKLVLSARQSRLKDTLAAPYGDWVHEGHHLDPAARDIEAFLISSQSRVTGTVAVRFRPGSVFVEGVDSPYSLMKASKGVYGEAAGEWSAQDALGYSKMLALPGTFYTRAGSRANPEQKG
jgi:argininosuccinate synthase